MKKMLVALTVAVGFGGTVVQADEVINGGFEDVSFVHPEWRVTAVNPSMSASVVIDPVTGCSFARLAHLNEAACDRVSLKQLGLQLIV